MSDRCFTVLLTSIDLVFILHLCLQEVHRPIVLSKTIDAVRMGRAETDSFLYDFEPSTAGDKCWGKLEAWISYYFCFGYIGTYAICLDNTRAHLMPKIVQVGAVHAAFSLTLNALLANRLMCIQLYMRGLYSKDSKARLVRSPLAASNSPSIGSRRPSPGYSSHSTTTDTGRLCTVSSIETHTKDLFMGR